MVRVPAGENGALIEVEVWEMAAREFGSFVAGIPAPLGIGTITLANGEPVQGFVCEQYADLSHSIFSVRHHTNESRLRRSAVTGNRRSSLSVKR